MLTQLSPDLIGVSVPSDATEVRLGNHCLGFKSDKPFERDSNGWCIVSLGLWAIKKFEILGYCTKDEVSFDVEDVVQSRTVPFTWDKFYLEYTTNEFTLFNRKDSFRSLLYSKGIYFVNPYGEKEPETPWQDNIMHEGLHKRYKDALCRWHETQSKVVEKVIILKKV